MYDGNRYCYELCGESSLLRTRIGQYFPQFDYTLQLMLSLLPCDMSSSCEYGKPQLREMDAAIEVRHFYRSCMHPDSFNSISLHKVTEYSLRDRNLVVAVQLSAVDVRVVAKVLRPFEVANIDNDKASSILNSDTGAELDEFLRFAIICNTDQVHKVATIIAMFREAVQRIFIQK